MLFTINVPELLRNIYYRYSGTIRLYYLQISRNYYISSNINNLDDYGIFTINRMETFLLI